MQSRNIIIGGDVIAAIDIALLVVLRGPLHQDRPRGGFSKTAALNASQQATAQLAVAGLDPPVTQDPSRKTRGPAMAPC